MTTATLERVHSATGRIDARLVAELYGISLAALADVLGEKYETLRKQPARDAAQVDLSRLVFAWNELQGVLADDDHIRRWLHHPLPRDGRRPLDILLSDHGVESYLALVGQLANNLYE